MVLNEAHVVAEVVGDRVYPSLRPSSLLQCQLPPNRRPRRETVSHPDRRGQDDDAGGGGEGPVGQGFQLGIMHEDIVPRLPDVMWSITDSGGEAEG